MKKTTITAVGVFAALLALVLLTREKQVNEGVPRLQLAPLSAEVTAFELTGPTPARLEQTGGAWKVNGFAADEAQVKALLDALKDFRAQDFVTDKLERHAEFELDDAKGTRLALSTSAGPSWVLVFGKAAKGGGTYVRDAKFNAVFTTNSPLAWQVKKGVSGWRHKLIATAAAADLVKVTVTQPDSVLGLVNTNGAWALEHQPAADFRFDAAAAQRLVQQLSSLQAQDFADQPATAVATIDLQLKDGKTRSLKLGAKTPAGTVPLSLDGDAQSYLLPAWTADQLLKKLEDVRDTSLLLFEPDKVARLTVVSGGKSTVLAKDASGWKVLEPKALPAGFEFDPAAVTAQLQRLRTVRAARVVSGVTDAAAGLTRPAVALELQLEGGGKQVLKFGSETPSKELYVKGSADGLTYAIGAQERQQLEQGLELFKKRPPPDMSQIRGLEQLPPEVRRQLEAQLRQKTN